MPVALPGWKDTFRVNPGDRGPDDAVISAEMLTIFGQFSQHAGRYMYHCHILEHEDVDMMRPFVVLPGPLMAFMGHADERTPPWRERHMRLRASNKTRFANR